MAPLCAPRSLRLCLLGVVACAGAGRAQTAAAQGDAAVQPPSSLVRPALDTVSRAGNGVDLNRWHGSGAVREETDANLASIQKDLQTTLPPLLTAADAAPTSAAAALPVLLNLDALYSVLLRVTIASRGAAPREQTTALEQASTVLDSARRDLGHVVLASATAAERRISELQATLQQQQSALQQPPQPPTPPPAKTAPAKGKKRPAPTAPTR